jgi:hypothetical protein
MKHGTIESARIGIYGSRIGSLRSPSGMTASVIRLEFT